MPRQQTIRINQGYRIDSKWEALAVSVPRRKDGSAVVAEASRNAGWLP